MKLAVYFLTFFLFGGFNTQAQTKSKITYIANEGFLIESAEKKVIVDGLFNKIKADWCDSPCDSIVELMKVAKAPFNDIDLVVVTHKHVDHFNAEVVVNHLLNNKKAKIICPQQVKDVLTKKTNFNKIKSRIIAITPQLYKDTNLVISDINIRILRLEHSHYMIEDTVSGEKINKHRNIENLGYVININGAKFFHCGDTNPLNEKEYINYSLKDEKIDIAFTERIFFAKGETSINILNKYIAPKNIILMHIRDSNKAIFKKHFENETVKIFDKMMDSKIYKFF